MRGITSRRVDFLHPRRTPPLGWGLLASGVVALGLAFGLVQRWDREQDVRQAALRESELAQERARQDARRPVLPSALQRRLLFAQSALQRPWLPVLQAVENATQSPVYLLALTADPLSGRVQLDAEAPSFDHALAYVQRLDETGALLPGLMLEHEAVVPVAPDHPLVHFTAVSRWRQP